MTDFCIKIVPDKTPNADGRWIDVPVDLSRVRGWRVTENIVAPYVPNGFHVVAVARVERADATQA